MQRSFLLPDPLPSPSTDRLKRDTISDVNSAFESEGDDTVIRGKKCLATMSTKTENGEGHRRESRGTSVRPEHINRGGGLIRNVITRLPHQVGVEIKPTPAYSADRIKSFDGQSCILGVSEGRSPNTTKRR